MVVILVCGLAAAGKSTFVGRLNEYLIAKNSKPFILNLDPACLDPSFPVNIDIRDTINYKNVMKQYKLGPNGAIMTCLNIFTTKFDQILDILKERSKTHEHIIIDTPGQIEVFMWSASGQIIAQVLAAHFPTVLIYVTDLVINQKPTSFVSNMLTSCSILYKFGLPLMITFNKADLVDPTKIVNWITDFDSLDQALREDDRYFSNFCSSISLAIEELYKNVKHCIISALNGTGFDEFMKGVEESVEEYHNEYLPVYKKLLEEKGKKLELAQKKLKKKPEKDMETSSKSSTASTSTLKLFSGMDGGAGLTFGLNQSDEEDAASEESSGDETNEENAFNEAMKNTSDD